MAAVQEHRIARNSPREEELGQVERNEGFPLLHTRCLPEKRALLSFWRSPFLSASSRKSSRKQIIDGGLKKNVLKFLKVHKEDAWFR